MPKLIFVNRFFYPDETATSQLLTDLCFHLASRGAEVEVITSRLEHNKSGAKLPKKEVLGGVTIKRIWSTQFGLRGGNAGRAIDYLSFYPSLLLQLVTSCRHGDVVVAKTDPPLLSVVALLAVKLRRAKLVNWLQDLYPEVAAELGVGLLRGPFGLLLANLRNFSLRAGRANVAIGNLMAQRLVKVGVDENAVRLIPNWTDEQTIRPIEPSASATRFSWGIANDMFVLGYSGNLGRAHESETILAAAEFLRDRDDICFLFVGGGRESEKLKDEVKRRGLSNFIFKPHRPREALSDALAAADCHWLSLRPEMEGLIVPSKFYGIASAGRPVISVTSLHGEIGEIVRVAGCGLVVEPGDGKGLAAAIIKLADDPPLRRKMGRAARELIEKDYSRQTALTKWEALLKDLQG